MDNHQVRVNPLGQIADSVVEQLQSTGSQAVKQVAAEPAKILEQILGGGSPQNVMPESGEQQLEQGGHQTSQSNQIQQQTELLQRKRQESQQKAQELYKLHQQRLQEEVAYHEQRKQEEKQEKQIEVQQAEQKKQQIVQLKRERDENEVWQQQIKAVQGSHEGQQGKM